MAPRKGTTNNPNGRPKGSKNKLTDNLKQAVLNLVEKNWKLMLEDMKKLSPKDRVLFMEKMISYVLPKTTTVEGGVKNINYNVPVTSEEVREIAKALENEC